MKQLLVFLYAYLLASSWALLIKVKPRSEECFFEKLAHPDEMVFEWNVRDGGLLDIEIKVKYQEDIVWSMMYIEDSNQTNEYTIKATTVGNYGVCFDNTKSHFISKIVDFRWHKVIEKTKSSDGKRTLIGMIEKAKSMMSDIESQVFQYGDKIEIRNRVSERINSSVIWYSAFGTLVVLSLSLFQIMFLVKKVNKSRKSKRRV